LDGTGSASQKPEAPTERCARLTRGGRKACKIANDEKVSCRDFAEQEQMQIEVDMSLVLPIIPARCAHPWAHEVFATGLFVDSQGCTVKNVDRRKREHALPANMTVSHRGDVSTRAANCRVGALHPPALPGQGPRGGWKPPTLHLIRHSREGGSPDVRENWIPAFGRVEKPRFRLPDARTGVFAPLRDMNFHNREWGRHSCLPCFSTGPGGQGHEPIRSFVTGTRHDLITK